MKKLASISMRVMWVVFAMLPLAAKADTGVLQESFKASLNKMVVKVKTEEDPAAKREILENYLARMDRGLEAAKVMVSEKDMPSLDALREKIEADRAELDGIRGHEKVANANLNRFADYVQQDVEQASYIYISTCGLLVLLIILLILL